MQKLRSMKISKQLILTFGITVIMFLSIIVTALYSAATISDNYTDFYEKSFEVVKTSMSTRIKNMETVLAVTKSLAYHDKEEQAALKKEIMESVTVVEENLGQMDMMDDALVSDAEVSKLTSALNELKNNRDKVLDLIEQEKYDEASKLYQNKYEASSIKMRNELSSLEAKVKKDAAQAYSDGKSTISRMMIFIALTSVIMVIFLIAMWIWVYRNISHPIIEIKKAARELSEGNLRTEIQYESGNELGELADRINQRHHPILHPSRRWHLGTLSVNIKSLIEINRTLTHKIGLKVEKAIFSCMFFWENQVIKQGTFVEFSSG